METFSWRKYLKLNAARCSSGTHTVTWDFSTETFVTSGSRVKRFLIWVMSKWRTSLLPSMKKRMNTLSWRKDLKLNAARCFRGTHATVRFSRATVVTGGSRVKFAFDQGDVKVENVIVTFNEKEYEDILVEEGLQIERDTVFHKDTCQREVHQRNICDKRLPREACFDLGDVKVEKDIVTFNEEEHEDRVVEE